MELTENERRYFEQMRKLYSKSESPNTSEYLRESFIPSSTSTDEVAEDSSEALKETNRDKSRSSLVKSRSRRPSTLTQFAYEGSPLAHMH